MLSSQLTTTRFVGDTSTRAPTKLDASRRYDHQTISHIRKLALMERKKRNVPPTFTGLMVVTFTPVKAFILLDRLRDDWCIGPTKAHLYQLVPLRPRYVFSRSRLRVVHRCRQQIGQRAV